MRNIIINLYKGGVVYTLLDLIHRYGSGHDKTWCCADIYLGLNLRLNMSQGYKVRLQLGGWSETHGQLHPATAVTLIQLEDERYAR